MLDPNIIAAFQSINYTWLLFALAFILLDIVSGICKGAATAGQEGGGLSSEKMKQGFWHKLAIILALFIAALIDAGYSAGLSVGFDAPIFEAACGYVVIMELLSILENIKVINPELAGSKLLQLFEVGNAPESDRDEDK